MFEEHGPKRSWEVGGAKKKKEIFRMPQDLTDRSSLQKMLQLCAVWVLRSRGKMANRARQEGGRRQEGGGGRGGFS